MAKEPEVRFNCFFPDCSHKGSDVHHHMYVNPDKDKWFCQRCRRGGSLEYLAKLLGVPQPDRSLALWDDVINNFLFGVKPDRAKPAFERADLPLDYVPMMKGTEAYRYVLERGLTDKDIETYQLGFGTQRMKDIDRAYRDRYAGKKRVIFPDFDRNEEPVYWVARTYGSSSIKYKNAGVPRDDKIFNFGRIQRREYKGRIAVSEGPLDATAIGFEGIATYGKYVTGTQISMLVEWGADEYVVAFDGDALSDSMSLATRLHRRGLNAKVALFDPGEDPRSVGLAEVRRRIRGAKRWNDVLLMKEMI